MTVSSPQNQLSNREKLSYGIGDIANGLAISSASFWMLIYLTDVVGMNPARAGLALMIGRIWDAFTDPLMGWISDRTTSRWGKRRPYIFFGAIAFSLSYLALWTVPEIQNEAALFLYVTLLFVVFNTCFTVVFVPYTSLTASMTTDYNERTSLTGYRMTCSQIAFLAGAALPSAAVLYVTSPEGLRRLDALGLQPLFGSWAGTARQGYALFAALFSVIIIAALWTTFFGVRERVESYSLRSQTSNPLQYMKLLYSCFLRSRPYRLAVLIILLSNCAATFIGVNLPYYIQYVLQLKADQTRIITLLFMVAIAAVPVWVLIAKKYGKAESYRVAMGLYTLGILALYYVPAGGINQIITLAVLNGFFHAAALMIPWAIVPDIVEHDELKTGERREGLFYGGTSFAYKLATALAIFLSGALLEFVGYVPNIAQSASTIRGIKSIMCFASIAVLLGAILCALKYPLTRERHAEILAQLERKRSSG